MRIAKELFVNVIKIARLSDFLSLQGKIKEMEIKVFGDMCYVCSYAYLVFIKFQGKISENNAILAWVLRGGAHSE